MSGPKSSGAQCMAGKGEGLDHLAYAAHHSHSTSGEIKLGRRRDWLRGGSSEHIQSSPQAVTRPPVTSFISRNFWSIGFPPGLVPPSFPRQDLQLIVEVFSPLRSASRTFLTCVAQFTNSFFSLQLRMNDARPPEVLEVKFLQPELRSH